LVPSPTQEGKTLPVFKVTHYHDREFKRLSGDTLYSRCPA
jgi:hypothetical protein